MKHGLNTEKILAQDSFPLICVSSVFNLWL